MSGIGFKPPASGKPECKESEIRKKAELEQFKDCAEGQVPAKRAHPAARLISAALVVAFIAAAGACTGKNPGRDTDSTTDSDAAAEVEDGTELEDMPDAPEIPDMSDMIDGEDGSEMPTAECPEPGESLPGVEDNSLKETLEWDATFSGTDGSVSGPANIEISAEIGTGIMWLPEVVCASGAHAAFGAEGEIPVAPQAKISLSPDSDASEGFPAGPDIGCEPLSDTENSTPVEANQLGQNSTARNLPVNGSTVPVELAFIDLPAPLLMVDGSEATSLVLGEGGLVATEVKVVLPAFFMGLAASISTPGGEALLSAMLESEITATLFGSDEIASGKAKIFQVGSSETVLPGIAWETPTQKACLRCSPGLEEHSITGTITALENPDCGIMHGGFVIEDLAVTIESVSPEALEDNYSVSSFYATGVGAFAGGTPSVTLSIQRAVLHSDTGEVVIIYVTISGTASSIKKNPNTDLEDRVPFSETWMWRDPDVWAEYWLECPTTCTLFGV